jgi:diguanylate cyclase (GGDEF)-like protein
MSNPPGPAHAESHAGASLDGNERRAHSGDPAAERPIGDKPRRLRNLALLGGVSLLALSIGLGLLDGRAKAQRNLDQRLQAATTDVRTDIRNYFERARALNLLLANNPAFANFYKDPRPRDEKVRIQTVELQQANAALTYIKELYPGRIGEACFIDRGGAENARVVNGKAAAPSELSPDETTNDFFAPSFALEPGQVFQAKPYISPDTDELVISNATLVPVAGRKAAIVHFEVKVESFRSGIAGAGVWMRIADSATGEVVADSRLPQVGNRSVTAGASPPLRPLVGRPGSAGSFDTGSDRIRFTKIAEGASNANRWVVVATAPKAGFDLSGLLFGWPAAMMAGALAMLGLAGLGFRSYQRELRRQALTDELTGLPNRVLFRDRIDRAINLARRENARSAVMIVDIDRFKDVNDTLGHRHGDLLLKEVAARLLTSVRDSDTVTRLGGDEFGILLTRIDGPEDVQHVSDRIREQVVDAFVLDGVPVQVDMSMGATMFPDHAADVETLIQRADIAMYDAKSTHQVFTMYDAARDTFNPRRLAMVPQLRLAIERGQLRLHFQPRVELATGMVEGVEALARWDHAEMGQVAPDEFIALAEDTGLIRTLTLSILDLAVSQAATWMHAGRPVRVSVNISARNLLEPGFPAQVAECVATHHLPTRLLQLEITETVLMSDTEAAIATINALHALGVGLSIDDFGTGYSSLAYLKRLPVEEIKIDKSFVFDMASDDADASIVRSTIALGKNLGLRVVAEGVETTAVYAQLVELGCDLAQGFLISRPLPPDELSAWLDEHRVAPDTPEGAGPGSATAAAQAKGRYWWTAASGGAQPATS